MTAAETLEIRADQLAELIEQKLGVRGRGLDTKLRKAGRALPAWLRREARALLLAQQMAGHPKLALQTDAGGLEKGLIRCEKWLKSVDPAKRRQDKLLGFLGTTVANMLIVGALFVTYLVWSGHV